MKVIGITGGVGAGKSTILNYISEICNSEIIIADDLAKMLCNPGERCFDPLVDLLGREVLSLDGSIDRAKMASMIFADEEKRRAVNEIIHPAVKKYILERIAYLSASHEKDYLFIEAALLIEDGYKEIVDEMWYIYTDVSVRRERLKQSRGYSDEKIDGIIKSQLSDEEFILNSDFVIDNSKTEEESFLKIRERLGETDG